MEAFGNLTKTLRVHSLVIVLPQQPHRTFHLIFHKFLTPPELFRVLENLVLLVSHFALKFGDLALKQLHLLRP